MNIIERLLERFLRRKKPEAGWLPLPGGGRYRVQRSATKAPFDHERRRKRNRAAERSRARNRP